MAGQQWKWDNIRGLYHMEDTADSSNNSNILTINGATNVAGKLNNAYSFTTDDYLTANGLITDCASDTKGTIAGWASLTLDNNAHNAIFTCSNTAGTGGTDYRLEVEADWLAARNYFAISLVAGGVVQFKTHTPINGLTALVGTYFSWVVTHDGTQVTRILLNNVNQTLTRDTTVDEALWLSDVITGGADECGFGSLKQNLTRTHYFRGELDEVVIVGNAIWDTDDETAFYNGGAGQVIEGPDSISGLTTRFAG